MNKYLDISKEVKEALDAGIKDWITGKIKWD